MITTQRTRYTSLESPIGELLLVGDGEAITGIHIQGGRGRSPIAHGWLRDDDAFADAHRQLDEYFAAERTEFDLPLAPRGSEFQRRVWKALRRIPYGETASYGEIARRIDGPDTVRAVGAANGANPIAIVVPCHRVIGADGSLTGYAGGLERKAFLLELERGAVRLPGLAAG
jgi:methylated-DNA-[protein]-cysteine S-methyltransferase